MFRITLMSLMAIVGIASAQRPTRPAEEPQPPAAVKQFLDEQATYLQRLEMCTRLRQVGEETGDDALIRKARDLEDQATELFHKKTAMASRPVPTVEVARPATPEVKPTPKPRAQPIGRAPNGKPIYAPEER